MLKGISEMVNSKAFKPLPLCSAPLKTLLRRNYWSSNIKGKPHSPQKCVLRKCCGKSQEQ